MAAATHVRRKRPAEPGSKYRSSTAGFAVLSARSFCHTHDNLTRSLRKADLHLVTSASWEKLLLIPDDEAYDAVLVDMDAVERTCRNKHLTISGHRLVSLLAKHLATKPTALIVMTSLDFAEVEDLARSGVHAFLSPDATPHHCVEHIRAAISRVRKCRSRRVPLALDSTEIVLSPVTAPSAESAPAPTH
jgi:DNA-binding NarL/FixJ family response regulator